MKCLTFDGYFCLLLLAISSLWFISGAHTQCVEDESSADKNSTTECINGVCVEGKCECDQGWTGAQCDECGGRVLLDADTGFISDGMKDYAKKRECSWIIQPKFRNATIRLRVLEFATECGWDYLYIYDGDSASSPLLASFNGLLYTTDKDDSEFYGPEVVASSGTAFVHFFSDVEYVMKGFNISYTVDSCSHDCSNHGICNVSAGALSCSCESEWSGDACQFDSCPNNCSYANDRGFCSVSDNQDSVCNCTDGYQGADCSSTVPAKEGFWYNMNSQPDVSSVFASSHSGINYQDTLWVYGGIKFSDLSYNGTFDVYNFTTTQWDSVEPTSADFPTWRYGHSMVVHDDKIIMFGGREVLTSEASNEVWEFDISNRTWTKMSDNFPATFRTNGTSLALWGHTATLVKLSTGQNVMLVTFGFHTLYEYSGFVFEYDLDTNTWSKVNDTTGAKIEAAFGHSTTWDPVNNVCYIHGGIVFLKPKKYGITDSLISYDVNEKKFVALRPSGVPRYFHTGLLVNGMLLVYGGCTHNDSDRSSGALCFTPNFMAYSVACDSWHTLPSLDDKSDSDRYGHITVAVDGSNGNSKTMVVHGGYDGRVLNSLLYYQTGSCDAYSGNETACTGIHHNGIACQWNDTRCVSAEESLTSNSVSCSSNAENLASYCPKLQSCASCLNAGQNCFWCENKCTAEECEESDSECPSSESVYCERFRTCGQCELNENCQWRQITCVKRINNETANCQDSCGMQKSCSDCVGDNCMWCPNKNLCVSTTSYVAQFPYGECMKWVNENSQCESTEGCASHRTCGDCLSDPFCGWCDNGQKTGIGTCIKGSLSQPQLSSETYNVLSYSRPTTSNSTCESDRWYFVQCPLCQCNGHSTCVANTSQCISCQNNTTGDQCERCSDGYFGKATNGGTCEPCECYGRADVCDHTNGKCFCNTKGVEGEKCDQCDNSGKYYGDPANNGTCFYRLLINYSFTFSLSTTHDQYITAINFENTPAEHSDAELNFESQIPCNVRLTVYSSYRILVQDKNSSRNVVSEVSYGEEVEVARVLNVKKFSYDISGSIYGFGDTSTNATIRIYVSNITVPTLIKVSLVQRNQYLLMLLLILFSCFLVLLLLTAMGWKLKLLLDACRQRRQREVQLEQMAARPFATIYLSVDDYQAPDYILTAVPDENIDVVSEETHSAGQASLVSVLLRMPSDDGNEKGDADSEYTPLAFGTALSYKKGSKNENILVRTNTASKSKKLKILFKRGRHPRTVTNHSEAVRASVRSQRSPTVVCHTDTAVPPSRSHERRSKRGRSSFSSLRSRSISPSNEPTSTQTSLQNTTVQPSLPCKDSRSEGVAVGGNGPRKDEANTHTSSSIA